MVGAGVGPVTLLLLRPLLDGASFFLAGIVTVGEVSGELWRPEET